MIPGIVAMQAATGGPLKPALWVDTDIIPTPFMVAPTTFDPATTTFIVLSGGNLIATHNVITYPSGVRSTAYKNSGRFYYEVTWTTVHGDNDFCSLITSTESYGDMVNTYPKGAVIFRSNGTIYSNGSLSGATQLGADIASGSVIQVAADLIAKRAWFRNGTGNWNGSSTANPATNTGGVTINATESFAPAVGFGGAFAAVNDQMTANFGQTAFVYTMPAGFNKWPSA